MRTAAQTVLGMPFLLDVRRRARRWDEAPRRADLARVPPSLGSLEVSVIAKALLTPLAAVP